MNVAVSLKTCCFLTLSILGLGYSTNLFYFVHRFLKLIWDHLFLELRNGCQEQLYLAMFLEGKCWGKQWAVETQEVLCVHKEMLLWWRLRTGIGFPGSPWSLYIWRCSEAAGSGQPFWRRSLRGAFPPEPSCESTWDCCKALTHIWGHRVGGKLWDLTGLKSWLEWGSVGLVYCGCGAEISWSLATRSFLTWFCVLLWWCKWRIGERKTTLVKCRVLWRAALVAVQTP